MLIALAIKLMWCGSLTLVFLGFALTVAIAMSAHGHLPFVYSGDAHEGAAWLTVALALATFILSLVFRGSVRCDARLPKLRMLAWAWSLENVLLAFAVYNRLFIYVGFNGMTRMRIVGLFGITAVLVGFVVVLVKIAKNHSFVWLIRR